VGVGKKAFLSFFGPREERKLPEIMERIRKGMSVVLVTDSGTPGISDPGARLIRRVHEEGFRIEPIPGPSALTMALSVSSLAGGAFVFEGFLSSSRSKRRKRLDELKEETRSIVLFEAPHRIRGCLEDLNEIFGSERLATMVREGTKLHEEIAELPLAQMLALLPEKPLGEFTLVIQGATGAAERLEVDPVELLRFAVSYGGSVESAARRVAEHFGIPRSRLLRAERNF
jgi:16S rRNA (cytidine1402-2'-O)-methyltransferase